MNHPATPPRLGSTIRRCFGRASFYIAWPLSLFVALSALPLTLRAQQAASAPVAASTNRAAELHRKLLDPTSKRVFVVAHRADWRNFPENSLPGIESAIAMGVDMAETDLQRTKDGHLVLMHDSTVDRTTTGKGKVSDLTLAQVRALRLRNGYGMATPFVVPTLREVLVVVHGRILLNLDKSYSFFREVMPLLAETGTTDHILMKGSAPAAMAMAENGDLLAKVAYMPVIDFRIPGASELARAWLDEAKPCAMEIVFSDWTPAVAETFASCRKRGVRIWVNVLWPELGGGMSDDLALPNPDSVYGVLLDRGVSMFQSDRPRTLQAYLAQRATNRHEARP